MMEEMKWRVLGRRAILESEFLNVYSETVELPNGTVIGDYTIVEKRDAVVVVATTGSGEFLALREYKHGAKDFQLTFPAGCIEKGEDPISTAKRELMEETGYASDSFSMLGMMTGYSSKDTHRIYAVMAKNVARAGEPRRESTESISEVRLVTADGLREEIRKGLWRDSASLGALMLSGFKG